MPAADFNMNELHWLMDMFNTVDVGLVVLDRDYKVCIWNGFMENHSGLLPSAVKDRDLFDLFPSIDEKWFRSKSESVFILNNRSFTIWEQQPYIFRFKNYRPITGKADHMYQNATFIPLTTTTGEVSHICIIIYDVTDEAVNKKELEEANSKLELMSRTDALTQLTNRGFWEQKLRKEYMRIVRSGGCSTLLMFDIDHFKNVNDEHGHSGGDEALRHVADLLRKTLRETDLAGRYGGEEFAITLLDTDYDGAVIFAERLRELIENSSIYYKEQQIKLTVSIGFACFDEKFDRYEKWIEAADNALYHSKENGRNKVTAYSDLKD
ncbi:MULTISPECIES: diguanylate cyclase [unclassified Pseudoalteromonas]|jgi:diguanylate cyclase (GGDEF)-like protein|uniref:sensor domain-containing diguanylate cyclase n=1 Tax=unclassified Pseudoalteromonas TaxID=194690 RepID=UPI001022D15D|nr:MULTISPECIES: diguanylate cyclase [Gammaproteobacteria]MCF7500305.1 diguanylate cyclase [Pseudoalteromonas sp. L1]RZF91561.1 sensor domain-containing diguanylate cyclase [Pseudoalteromonas sp. CO302Y]RZG07308.1 sensor domain-containing diguanylate cyclase [Pseudoalteromonas sp. CO133X]WOC27557.1 diguanylate cyclase [Pseudoalteromonas sp. N1230-9]MCF7518342.1 diguanylate cyclase [Pseudoalteromonas sp. L21]|tara:strand:+ start:2205 stop:3173 length:969 start_codon:yes stop_codon:yes gene_type:complete